MNSYLALAILILFAGVLITLPLAPAFAEFHRKSDALPLSVVQKHAGQIRYFADGFRNYIKAIEPILDQCRTSGAVATGTMPDGVEYLVLGRGEEALVLLPKPENDVCLVLIAAAADLSLPSQTIFSKDIYACGRITGGTNNQYRAILGESDIHLASSSTVMRWVHAAGEVSADAGCGLYGRISSDRGVRLSVRCSFLRLNAPRIELGHAKAGVPAMAVPIPIKTSAGTTPRRLHHGNLELRPGEIVHGNLIVRGRLRVGAGARIYGSVKCEKDLFLESDVTIAGSVITTSQMHIGPNCFLHGPVIAEHALFVESGTQCGTWNHPTTVSAPHIEAEEGVLIFGTLWAREQGLVVTRL